jgi:PAS domain S-box-containing protein
MERDSVSWSEELFRIFGVDPAGFVPSNSAAHNLIHPDDRALHARLVSLALGGERIEAFDCRIVRPSGELRYVRASGFDLDVDASGKPVFLFGTVLDVTDQKTVEQELCWHRDHLADLVKERTRELEARNERLDEAVRQCQLVEESLRRSEARYRALFDYSLDAIFWAESDGMISAVNKAACSMFQMTEEELCRVGRAGIVDGCDQRVAAMVKERDRRGYVRNEMRFKRKDGSRFWAELSSFLIGSSGSYFVVVRDISDRRQAEEEVQELNATLELRVKKRTAELEAAVRDLESFSYSVSHDFRAPLRHINNYSAILIEDFGSRLPKEALHYLDRMGEASSRMGALIDHLLELSRVGRVALCKVQVDLSALARTVGAALAVEGDTRRLELVVEEGLMAKGDPILLRQLLENLFDNAWKYSAGEPVSRLEFGGTRVGGQECFYLKDNGTGFDMSYSHKLFKVFERLHGSEYQGVGIGLATVQRIVERHGGKVWADGKVGEGAVFYFTLP